MRDFWRAGGFKALLQLLQSDNADVLVAVVRFLENNKRAAPSGLDSASELLPALVPLISTPSIPPDAMPAALRLLQEEEQSSAALRCLRWRHWYLHCCGS